MYTQSWWWSSLINDQWSYYTDHSISHSREQSSDPIPSLSLFNLCWERSLIMGDQNGRSEKDFIQMILPTCSMLLQTLSIVVQWSESWIWSPSLSSLSSTWSSLLSFSSTWSSPQWWCNYQPKSRRSWESTWYCIVRGDPHPVMMIIDQGDHVDVVIISCIQTP